jgi:putative redox protein
MVSATSHHEKYRTELLASGHLLLADEPVAEGGADKGPTPEEYLQLALASCTAVTLRMFVERKNWPVESIRVNVRQEKTAEGTRFYRDVAIDGALPEEQRARLLQIANACPVHKILTHPIDIQTALL